MANEEAGDEQGVPSSLVGIVSQRSGKAKRSTISVVCAADLVGLIHEIGKANGRSASDVVHELIVYRLKELNLCDEWGTPTIEVPEYVAEKRVKKKG